MLGLIAIQLIGLFRAKSILYAVAFIYMWILAFFVYNVISRFFDNRELFIKFIHYISLSGAIIGAIAIFQVLLMHYAHLISDSLNVWFNPFWHFFDMGVSKLFVGHIFPSFLKTGMYRVDFIRIASRASSTFTNPLMLASYLNIILPFSVFSLYKSKGKKGKFFGIIAILLILGGIAASYSRSAYLSIIIVLIFLMLYGKKSALGIIAALILLMVVTAFVAPSVYMRVFSLFNNKDISIVLRGKILDASIQAIKDNWLFGMGTGVGGFRNYLISLGIKQPHAHNLFFQIWIENGIAAILMFLSVIVLYFKRAYKMLILKTDARRFAATLIASMMGLISCGMFDYTFYGPKLLICFAMILGIADCADRALKNNKENEKNETASTETTNKE